MKEADDNPAEEKDAAVERIYRAGCGHADLHQWREAAREFKRVPRNAPDGLYARAQRQLVFVDAQRQAYAQAARRGLRQVKRGDRTGWLLTEVAVMLHHAGRTGEARDFSRRHAADMRSPLDLYNLACFESALGDFEAALKTLEQAFDLGKEIWPEPLLDTDLTPLWRAWDDRAPSLAQAQRLLLPTFEQMAERAAEFHGEFEVGDQDLLRMPERFRALLDFPLGRAVFKLDPLRASRQPALAREYLAWQRAEVAANVRRLRNARALAREKVLAAQADFAGEKAAAGCFAGARWHLTWALGERPAMLAAFLAEPRLQRWERALLAPAVEAQALDPGFFPRLAACISAALKKDLRGAEEIWRETPGELLQNPFHRFVLSVLWLDQAENARALPLCLEVCQAWREDAMAFNNAALCLMRLERWEEAVRLIDLAPAEARALPLLAIRREAAAARTLEMPSLGQRFFCGQRDLGGLWPLPEAAPDAQDKVMRRSSSV